MGLDEAIRAEVAAGVEQALAPYLRRLGDPEPKVYSVPQAAKVLCTSERMVRQLIAEGVLATVPHMGTRVLVPRWSVAALVDTDRPVAAAGPDAPADPSAGAVSGPTGTSGRRGVPLRRVAGGP